MAWFVHLPPSDYDEWRDDPIPRYCPRSLCTKSGDMTSGTQGGQVVLLIEDDLALAEMVRTFLGDRGYPVWHAANGAEAAALSEEITPDLVIVDLMLPDADGLVLCADLLERWPVPIIICSASKRPEDPVLGLKLGADDFVRKPFSCAELEARIAAALRRAVLHDPACPTAKTELAVGPLAIDRARCRVTLGGEPVYLTPTEYQLLCVLAEHPNRVHSSRELAEHVRGQYDSGIGHSLQVHLRRMRAKLTGASVRAPELRAVRGFGYELVWEAPARRPPGRISTKPSTVASLE
jgi:DNA-binding response OmpR family regulator